MRLSGGALRRADMYSHGGQGDGLSGPSKLCNHKVRHSKVIKQCKTNIKTQTLPAPEKDINTIYRR